jgi:hypothetical protein
MRRQSHHARASRLVRQQIGNLQSHPSFAVPEEAPAEHRRKLQKLERAEREAYLCGRDHQPRSSNREARLVKDDLLNTAEYQGGDAIILSRAPLIGILELTDNRGEPLKLRLDRPNTEVLMAALTKFLLKGDGDDAPSIAPGRDASG